MENLVVRPSPRWTTFAESRGKARASAKKRSEISGPGPGGRGGGNKKG